jgi:hypothetical protein
MKRDERAPLATRLKRLRFGKTIRLSDEAERTAALQVCQQLTASGEIRYYLRTGKHPKGGFIGIAMKGLS